jgi:phosphatidylinositol-3-phosphatase
VNWRADASDRGYPGRGVAHNSLPNYVALVSGQAPTLATQADCALYADVLPGLPAADGQVIGQGCVYPAAVKTVADQLDAAGFSRRGYMEDMGNDPARDGDATCAHPALGTPDATQQASAGDQYATRHNPFVYLHSIIDSPARCAAGDVPLSRLTGDLPSAATTPNVVFITPDLCHDGHDATCADGGPGGQSGGPGGGRTGAVLLSPQIPGGTVVTQAPNHYGLLRGIDDAFGLAHLGYAATTQGALWP